MELKTSKRLIVKNKKKVTVSVEDVSKEFFIQKNEEKKKMNVKKI